MLKSTLRTHLLQTCTEQELRQWYDPLQLSVTEEDKALAVGFPHAFFADWFAHTVQNRFEEEVHRFMGSGFTLSYCGPSAAVPGGNGGHRRSPEARIDFPFGSQFTFESFLSNAKNHFPLQSARDIALNTHVDYNPFVICGGNGSGKTHLMRSIANEFSKRFDKEKIFLGSIEDLSILYNQRFRNDIYSARRYLYDHSFLMIDDLRDIQDHPGLQEELIILFNHFRDNLRQMVFSCSEKIPACSFLNPKLKSRLEWGLSVHLKAPDLDVRIQFIQEQCRIKNLRLSKEQILTLANIYQEFRSLQGIMLKLTAFREMTRRDISNKDFQQILSHTEHRPMEILEPETILDAVAEHYDISVKDITGGKRVHRIVQARQVAMYLCRQLIGCSYPTLGRIFGGKDHSTAMYAIKKIEKLQRDKPEVKELVTSLKKKCLTYEH